MMIIQFPLSAMGQMRANSFYVNEPTEDHFLFPALTTSSHFIVYVTVRVIGVKATL
jgi:hypothetical protein